MSLGVVSINPSTYPELFTVDGVNRFSFSKDVSAKTAEVVFPCKVGRQKIEFTQTGINIYIAKWEVSDGSLDLDISNMISNRTLSAYSLVVSNARPTVQYWDGSKWANGTYDVPSLDINIGKDQSTGKLTLTYSLNVNLGASPTTLEMKVELAKTKDRLKLSFITPASGGLKRRIRFRIPFMTDSVDLLDYDSSGITTIGRAKRIIQNILIDFSDAPDMRMVVSKTNMRVDIYTPNTGTTADINIDPMFAADEISSTVMVQNFFGAQFENADDWPKTRPLISKWDARTQGGTISGDDLGGGKLGYTIDTPPFTGWDGAAYSAGTTRGELENICGYAPNLGQDKFNLRLKFRFEYAWDSNYFAIFWTADRRGGYIGSDNRIHCYVVDSAGSPRVIIQVHDRIGGSGHLLQKELTFATSTDLFPATGVGPWLYLELDYDEARTGTDKLWAWLQDGSTVNAVAMSDSSDAASYSTRMDQRWAAKVGTVSENYTITAASNDQFRLVLEGVDKTITLAAGIGLTAAQVAADMQSKFNNSGIFTPGRVVVEDIGGVIRIRSSKLSIGNSVGFLAPASNSAHAALGFPTANTYYGRHWFGIGYVVSGNTNPHAVAQIALYGNKKRSASATFIAPTEPIASTDTDLTFLWNFDKRETTPGKQFAIVFDEAVGGCITRWHSSLASPNEWLHSFYTAILADNLASTALLSIEYDDGTAYADSSDGSANLYVLEDSPSRVRIRSRALLTGSKYSWTEYTIYPDGRIYIKHQFQNDVNIVTNQTLRLITTHQDVAGSLVIAAQDGLTDGTNHFFTGTRAAGLNVDFAWVLHSAYFDNTILDNTGDPKGATWEKNGTFNVAANGTAEWFSLFDLMGTYTVESDADAISADFRDPKGIRNDLGAAETDNFGDDDADAFIEAQGAYPISCGNYYSATSNKVSFVIDGASQKVFGPTVLIRNYFPKKYGSPNDKTNVRFASYANDANSITSPQIGDGTGAQITGVDYNANYRGNGVYHNAITDETYWKTGAGAPNNLNRAAGTVEFVMKDVDGLLESAAANLFFIFSQASVNGQFRFFSDDRGGALARLNIDARNTTTLRYYWENGQQFREYFAGDVIQMQLAWDIVNDPAFMLWMNSVYMNPHYTQDPLASAVVTDAPFGFGNESLHTGNRATSGMSFRDIVVWGDILSLWSGMPMIAGVPVVFPTIYADGTALTLGNEYELAYIGSGNWVLKFLSDYTTKVSIEVSDVNVSKARNVTKLMRGGKYMSAGRTISPSFG